MPHGDPSDYVAFTLLPTAIALMVSPSIAFASLGPLKPAFEGSAELETALRIFGGFLLPIGLAMSAVRWNTINGPPTGLCFLAAGANLGKVLYDMDGGAFVPRTLHVYVAVAAVAGLHLMFNTNPVIKPEKKD